MARASQQDRNRSKQDPDNRPQADQPKSGDDRGQQAGDDSFNPARQGGGGSATPIRDWASI